MGPIFVSLFLTCLVVANASPFRFTEGGMRPDFLGEAGLNAVPRMGRRSPSGNPFDPSRFRFRFHGPSSNWLGSRSALAGFRFSGEEADPNQYFQLKKRMAGGDDEKDKKALENQEATQAMDNNAQANLMERYADSFMKDYLSSLAQKAAYEKLAFTRFQSIPDNLPWRPRYLPPISQMNYETPLQKFLNTASEPTEEGDEIEPMKIVDPSNGRDGLSRTSHLFGLKPFMRMNY
ncbi:hypothetical protein TCAL_14269 [Tigriopus californicus]|uniref:Uncharacterized protein n=1 Tax=Tigriopus californicus TaxID=6832 RepID=A0A553NV00_TIGCA|nr:uncharacterized protein LOC131883642 [Tigriopus californicus]TRY69261.1 hypothetical protein TCAL_14269 [Tigriopus californicus]